MWLEATLDARSVAPVLLPQGEFPLILSGASGTTSPCASRNGPFRFLIR